MRTEIANGKTYHIATIKEIKKGQFFTLIAKAIDETPNEKIVWCKGDYDRSTKKWSIYKFSNICHENFAKGNAEVCIDFIF